MWQGRVIRFAAWAIGLSAPLFGIAITYAWNHVAACEERINSNVTDLTSHKARNEEQVARIDANLSDIKQDQREIKQILLRQHGTK